MPMREIMAPAAIAIVAFLAGFGLRAYFSAQSALR